MLISILCIIVAIIITIIIVQISETLVYISKVKKNKKLFKRIIELEEEIQIHNKKLEELHTSYLAVRKFRTITEHNFYSKKIFFTEYSEDIEKAKIITGWVKSAINTITTRKQEAEREQKRLQGIAKVDKLKFKIIARFI